MQTDYCIDATIKAGFEHGFKMIVPANTNSTFDNKYMSAEQIYSYYNEFMWNRRYAECISFEEAATIRPDGSQYIYQATVLPDNLKLPEDYVEMKQFCGPLWNGNGKYIVNSIFVYNE